MRHFAAIDVFRAIEIVEVGSLRVPPRKDSVKKFWRPTMVDCEGGPALLAPTTAADVRNSGCTLRWKSGCSTIAGDDDELAGSKRTFIVMQNKALAPCMPSTKMNVGPSTSTYRYAPDSKALPPGY